MFYVVCYDISNDRRRTKVHKAMEDFGTRVQFSVFECDLDAEALERMRRRVAGLMSAREDGLRIYPLCTADVRKVKIIGKGKVTRTEAFRIV